LYDIDEGLSVLDFRPLDDAEEWRSDVEY
jgi:hypothetical protein